MRGEPWADEFVTCPVCPDEVRVEDMERVDGRLLCSSCATSEREALGLAEPEPLETFGVREGAEYVPSKVRRLYAGVGA